MYATIHNVKDIKVEGLSQQNRSKTYVNRITIETEQGETFELTLFSNNKEAIKGYWR